MKKTIEQMMKSFLKKIKKIDQACEELEEKNLK